MKVNQLILTVFQTKILKLLMNDISLQMNNICNFSSSSVVLPSRFKTANVKATRKK